MLEGRSHNSILAWISALKPVFEKRTTVCRTGIAKTSATPPCVQEVPRWTWVAPVSRTRTWSGSRAPLPIQRCADCHHAGLCFSVLCWCYFGLLASVPFHFGLHAFTQSLRVTHVAWFIFLKQICAHVVALYLYSNQCSDAGAVAIGNALRYHGTGRV